MPELNFKGKQHVYAHHMTVPYRPLSLDKKRSLLNANGGNAEDNLIIKGDNLHALKSLLPRYAGRIKSIYIDPPYNTGNEGWIYNDKVNSSMILEWFKASIPVDVEDMERHDKWLCMMWPRLQLLKELLSDDGVIFVSIDDNEVHNLRHLMDEIFDENNFVAQFVWVSKISGRQISNVGPAKTHEIILCYAREIEKVENWQVEIQRARKEMPETYKMAEWEMMSDNHSEYIIKNELHNNNQKFNEETRPNLVFDIYYNPQTGEFRCADVDSNHRWKGFLRIPPKQNNDGVHRFHAWRWSRGKIERDSHDLKVIEKDGKYKIYTKIRNFEVTTAKDLITNISGHDGALKKLGIPFNYPKPVRLIEHLLRLSTSSSGGDIVLDSFAGSGTTAHAVLALNKEDGGNRKFILVECEDYADTITAERVRRVIQGVPNAKDAKLREGLGGSFAFYTLGDPVDMESMLTGKNLPSYSAMAAWLLHTASGLSVGEKDLKPLNKEGLFYSGEQTDYYLLYRPDIEYLRGKESMLNEDVAHRIGEANRQRKKKAVVFAPGKYLGQRELTKRGITFCQLPYGIAGV